MYIVFSMSEARTDLCMALLQTTLLPAFQCRGRSSISTYSVCFSTRNGTAAVVLPKCRRHLLSYKSTAFSLSRSLLKDTFVMGPRRSSKALNACWS